MERCHVEERSSVHYEWEGHEHGRPSLSSKLGHTYASGHEEEEDLRRFARQVTQWLEQQIKEHSIDRMVVFAPPRFLGVLRKTCSSHLASCIEQRSEDLAHLRTSDLSVHPVILELVGLNSH